MVEYRLLGPLEARGNDVVPLGPLKQRAVLAILLLDANRTVSADQLIEHLWPRKAPSRPRTAVQVYVSGLRKALGSDVIETSGGGYSLHAEPHQLDSYRFEGRVSGGNAALARFEAKAAKAALS